MKYLVVQFVLAVVIGLAGYGVYCFCREMVNPAWPLLTWREWRLLDRLLRGPVWVPGLSPKDQKAMEKLELLGFAAQRKGNHDLENN
jgi:hypothetical protein